MSHAGALPVPARLAAIPADRSSTRSRRRHDGRAAMDTILWNCDCHTFEQVAQRS
jgi:hypothetical protein